MKRFFDFLIYSNVYIAVASVFFTVESQLQIGLAPQWHPYLFLILFATLFEYNLHKFVTVFLNKNVLKNEKFSWISQHLRLFNFIVFASVAGFIITCCFARIEVLLTLMPLGAITVLYSFPLYRSGSKIFRLREIPLAKIFLISLVWSATCVILPIVQSGIKVAPLQIILFIAERFLFVFAITIPFDIRDMESDRKNKLKTFPVLFGEKKVLFMANAALVVFMLMCGIHYYMQQQLFLLIAFLLSGLSTLYFLNSEKIKQQRHYHYGVLDGTMLFQGVLVLLCYYLSL